VWRGATRPPWSTATPLSIVSSKNALSCVLDQRSQLHLPMKAVHFNYLCAGGTLSRHPDILSRPSDFCDAIPSAGRLGITRLRESPVLWPNINGTGPSVELLIGAICYHPDPADNYLTSACCRSARHRWQRKRGCLLCSCLSQSISASFIGHPTKP
jgi:hypothetical protein